MMSRFYIEGKKIYIRVAQEELGEYKSNSPQCSVDLVNIEEVVKQGQLLLVAFACGKPEERNRS